MAPGARTGCGGTSGRRGSLGWVGTRQPASGRPRSRWTLYGERVHLGLFEEANELGAAGFYAAAWAAYCGLVGAGVPVEEIVKVLKGRSGRTPMAKDLVAGCKEHGVVLAQGVSGHWSWGSAG